MTLGEGMRRFGAGAVLALLAASPAGAGGIVLWDWQRPKLPRESEAARTQHLTVWCYDVRNPGHLLDCPYTLLFDFDPPDQNDIAWNGGHFHFVGRATAPTAIGTMTRCDPSATHTATGCAGSTLGNVVALDHTVPEVSGIITAHATLTFPPGWTCADYSECDAATHRTLFAEFYTSVGFPGLVELPSDPVHFVRCGDTAYCYGEDNVDPNHPGGFFGTARTVRAAQGLAATYQGFHPDRRLRLTDMSLPMGGLFDIHADWGTPHRDHRVGTAIDVSSLAADPSGARVPVDELELDRDACSNGLTRFTGEPQIHYNLRPCPQKRRLP
jgi:hypothetical protein